MDQIEKIWGQLVKNGFKVSTDTRKDLVGTIFFALKGEKFDGTDFVQKALDQGAGGVVVEEALDILQKLARRYRDTFNIPIIAIGGSNGKTTSRELIRCALATKYQIHATESNLNNHIGLPLSILAMSKSAEIGIFEIGANHPSEHTQLLEILNPTHVMVTNSGMDHLEGFGSPAEVERANEEINEWAKKHDAVILTNVYQGIEIATSLPLIVTKNGKKYEMQMVGDYNLENINRALTVALTFEINVEKALEAMITYSPTAQRSQWVVRDDVRFIVDCYNANPTSMMLALESFLKSAKRPRGAILGDMLELGAYQDVEHRKVVEFLSKQSLDLIILIGDNFKKALGNSGLKAEWFPDSLATQEWFSKQKFSGYTFLLKGSRGIKVEKVMG